MSGSIKNINVKIGSDATPFDKTLRNAESNARSLNKELRSVNQGLKFDAKSTVMLTQKQTLLNESVDNTKKKLSALKEAQRQMDAGEVEFTAEQYRELEREIAKTETQLKSFQRQQKQFADISAVQLQAVGKEWQSQGAKVSAFGGNLTRHVTLPALAAGAALAAIVIGKGFQRLEAIDTARAKLLGLRYDAQQVTAVMSDATAAVKGTSYGLDEAATAAATAVAAGVKTGSELTNYLTTVADAAAISGRSLEDMGQIFGKVQTTGKAQLVELNQLAKAGIPIYQYLSDEIGISTSEVKKWASAGKISAETFLSAVESAVGGAAKTIGQESLTGAIANINASISRIGANFLDAGGSGEGFFTTLKPLLVEFMGELNNAEEDAAEMGVAAAEAFTGMVNGVKGVVDWYKNLNPVSQSVINNLGLITLAAGPVLQITGGIMTASGKMAVSIGKASAAWAAETIAVKTNTAATVENTTATNSQLVKDGLSNTVKNLRAVTSAKLAASMQAETTVSIANAAATNAGSAATSGSTVRTIASTAATSAKTVAIGVATVAQYAWNASLAANPIATVALAAGALITVVGALGAVILNTTQEQDELTQSSQRQKQKIEELRSAYDQAVDAQGANSDAALAAKSALDEETASFSKTKQTIREFIGECEKASKVHDELMSSIEESTAKANGEAGSVLNLAAQYSELSSKTEQTEADKTRLQGITKALASTSGELSQALGEEGTAANLTGEQISALAKAEADRIRGQAQSDNYTKLLQDEVDLTEKLTIANDELSARGGSVAATYEQIEAGFQTTDDTAVQLINEISSLNKDLDENKKKQQAAAKAVAEYTTKQNQLKQALAFIGSEYNKVDLAAEKFGFSVDELNSALEEQAAIAEAEAAVAISELSSALEEYAAENISLQTVLSATGLSVDYVAERLNSQGYTVDDLKSKIDSYKSKATDAFSEIAVEAENSVQKASDTLTHNIDVTRNWSDNLRWLFADSGLSFNSEFISQLNTGGVEKYGAFLQDLRTKTDGDMSAIVTTSGETAQQLIDKFATAGQESTAAVLNEMVGLTPEMMTLLQQAGIDVAPTGKDGGDSWGSNFEEATSSHLEAAAQKGYEAGTSIDQNIANGVNDNAGVVGAAASTIPSQVEQSLSGIDTTQYGAKISSDIATGVSAGNGTVTASLEATKASIQASLAAMNFTALGVNGITTYARGLDAGRASVRASISATISAASSEMNQLVSRSYSIGTQASLGMANGIRGNSWQVSAAMASVVNAAIARGKAEADIRSPSRKTAYIGEMMDAGIENQFVKDRKRVSLAFGQTINSALNAGENAMRSTSFMTEVGANAATVPAMYGIRNASQEMGSIPQAGTSYNIYLNDCLVHDYDEIRGVTIETLVELVRKGQM